MEHFVSFGDYVRRRRKLLDITQVDLAAKVSCSPSMLRKIEGEERRPSAQLAELLATHLAIEGSQRELFLQMARGIFTPGLADPAKVPVQPRPPPLPPSALREEQTPFVAREGELHQLHSHLDQALQGQGRMVFVSGEAGRGKTSLLVEFAHRAMTAFPDLIVAGGSSDIYTGLGDPLLPVRDIFRMLAGDIENPGMSGIITRELSRRISRAFPVTVESLSAQGPNLIDTLVPGLALEARLSQGIPTGQISTELLVRLRNQRARRALVVPELQQDHLFEEISTCLNTLARQYPLLLMLDDLHWIDTSTAGLLGHLVMRIQQSPILIVGSLRPEDLAQTRSMEKDGQKMAHPLDEVLSESRRQFGRNLIDLERPDPNEEFEFINALLDQEPNRLSDEFRQHLTRITEGNPLFAVELLNDLKDRADIKLDSEGRWVESGSLSWEQIPARVEGVIEKRINRLPEGLRDLLTVASVQGETFFAEVIAQVKQIDAGGLTRSLSAELDRQHRLIREEGVKRVGSRRISQYRFRHHLYQKFLYDRLAASERMYLHEDVGQALEALYATGVEADDLPSAQLARHFQEARLGEKAGHYLFLAGQNAARLIAFEEAIAHFQRGLLLLEDVARSAEIDHLEFELTLALGQAFWHGGFVAESISTYEKANVIARALEDPEELARAALAYEEPRWRLSLDAARSLQYMREALDNLGEKESPLRVRLLVNLSRSLLSAGVQEELRTTIDQALLLARQSNDPVALCAALRIITEIDRTPETTAERLAALEELIVVARSINDHERLADALDLNIYDHLELGHIDVVDETIATQKKVAEEIKQPFQLHIGAVFQTMRAIMRGDFDRAEQLAVAAANISRQIGIADLDGIFGIHMFTIRRQQGRLREVAPIVKLYAAGDPVTASWQPGLALIYAALEMKEECRAIFEKLVSNALTFVPQDSLRAASLAYLTEVCSYLGDYDRAAILYRLLLPFNGRAVVVGGATACYGAADRYLGILAAVMGEWQAAERHFEAALKLDAQMGARLWLAHSRYEYAVMLLARGEAVDRPRALALLHEAQAAAKEMGMAYLMDKVTAQLAQYKSEE